MLLQKPGLLPNIPDRVIMKEINKRNEVLKFKPQYILYIVGIISIFVLIGNLRYRYLEHFQYVETVNMSALFLFSRVLDQKSLLLLLLKHFSFQLFLGYFVTSLLLIIPVFLLYFILRDIPGLEDYLSRFAFFNNGSEKNHGDHSEECMANDNTNRTDSAVSSVNIESPKTYSYKEISRKYGILLIVALVIIVLMVVVSVRCLNGIPINTDEFSYFFQANIMKSFRLFVPAPENTEYFKLDNVIIDGGKWYSKYTVGFPLLLAIGVFFGVPLIVNPVISIIGAIFLYLITKRLFSGKAAVIAVFIAFLSPFYFVNGASGFQPHISLACALLGAAYYYLLSLDRFKWFYPVMCAFLFTLGTLIRPVDAALWGLAFFLLSVYLLITRKNRAELFLRFLAILGAAIAGLFIVFLVNKIQTGEFLQFAFHRFQSKEVWGFNVLGHNIYKGVWNLFHYQARVISWSAVFFLEMALISFWGKEKRKVLFLWFIYLIFTFFFFGWYAIGRHEYGPRYLFTAFVFLIPASAYGITVILTEIKKRIPLWKTAQLSLFCILILFQVSVAYPGMQHVFRKKIFDRMIWIKLINRSMELQKEKNEKIAVFNVYTKNQEIIISNRNLYPAEKQNLAYFQLIEPEKDMKFLRENYPDFKPFMAICNPDAGTISLEPYPDPASMSPETKSMFYLFAGLTYRLTFNNPEKAKESWLEAYRLNGNNIAPLINLSSMLIEEGQCDEAVKYIEEIQRKNPDIPFIYQALGKIAEKKGRNKEAEKYYTEYIKRNPGSPSVVMYQERLMYYRKHGVFPGEQ